MYYQTTLLGASTPQFDPTFTGLERVELDETSWIDFESVWLQGSDEIFDTLVADLPLRQKTGIKMYDQTVDEPRLSAWWRDARNRPEPLPILREMRVALSDHYQEKFDSIGFNLYRDNTDSVAWHGDRHRHVVNNPVIAIVSVGQARPLKLRPRGGGPSHSFRLGHGDLLVMGGACQHDWEHCVPKQSKPVGPRLSITFRTS